uniref:Uncharacterized protein n=1 Tax=Halocaridina rubra TaxID=373956 RepID=A0AAN8XJX2_HALRR
MLVYISCLVTSKTIYGTKLLRFLGTITFFFSPCQHTKLNISISFYLFPFQTAIMPISARWQ